MSWLARLFPGSRSRRTGGGRARPTGTHEEGFGLIEVVIAFVILMAVLIPTASLLSNVIGQSASARERLTALSLAEQWIEVLNNTPLPSTGRNTTTAIPSLPKTNTSILQKSHTVRSTVAYTIYAEFTWAPAEGTHPDLCTSGLAPKLLTLGVRVDWRAGHKITDTALMNYPPAGLPKNGFVAVQVNGDPVTNPPNGAAGAWSTRVQTVPVTIASLHTTTPTAAPFTSGTLHPNQYGCVFQEVPLPPGKYKVSVANPTGATPSWAANDDELTSETQSTLTVETGEVTTVTFAYDEGSLIDLQYPATTATEGGVTCPGAGSIVCIVSGQAPANASAPASTPVAELGVRTATGWSVERPSGITRVAATACAGTRRCISVGYLQSGPAYSGASVSTRTSSPGFTADVVPAGVTALDGITCPSSTTCYAWGAGTSGAAILTGTVSNSNVTWKLDALPAATSSVSGMDCPGPATCFAIAATSSGPTILSLHAGTAWTAETLPISPAVTQLSQLTCPSATDCYAIGTAGADAAILSLGTGTTWAADTLPATPTTTRLSQIVCPSSTECYAIGTTQSGLITSAGILYVAATATKWKLASLTSGVTGLRSLTCRAISSCYAIGSKATGPAIVSRKARTTWQVDAGLPATASLSSLYCATKDHCFAVGTTTTTGTARATILSLVSAGSWVPDTLTGAAPAFLSAVRCSGNQCVAAGASKTGAVYLSGSPSGTTWTKTTAAVTGHGATHITAVVQGMYLGDVPISVSNPNLLPTSTLEVVAPATDVSQVGPLFPFTSGYSVAAAECPSEVASASASVTSTPGGTTTAALPMGLLPIEVVQRSTGAPVAGATLKATIADCSPLAPLSGSNPASFSLETTGALGLSELSVIYDTYDVTVTAGALSGHAVVKVTSAETIATTVPEPLPTPVTVMVT